jgi:hypothetical protein
MLRSDGLRRSSLVLALAIGVVACGSMLSVGRDFPSPGREAIRTGATTKAELVRMLGEPNQVGIKDGDQTWTWYYFKKGEPDLTKQLEVTFTPAGLVKSYSFSSNFPDDMKTLR